MRAKKLIYILLSVPLIVVACSPQRPVQPLLPQNQIKISRQEFGEDWPFTLDEGILACKGGGGAGEVVFTANGASYAVNGVAKGTKKYRPIEEVWADNSSLPGTKKNIGSIIERGLKLCQ